MDHEMRNEMQDEMAKQMNAESQGFEAIQNPLMDFCVQLNSSSMRADEIIKLHAGDLVLLDQTQEQDLALVVGNQLIGYGELVTVNGRYAVRINRVVGD